MGANRQLDRRRSAAKGIIICIIQTVVCCHSSASTKGPKLEVTQRACAGKRGGQALLLKRLEESDEISDLSRVQFELGHAGMTGHNPFRKSFFKRFDRVSFMKSSERRSNNQCALRDFVDRMAMRTVRLRKRLASHDVRRSLA